MYSVHYIVFAILFTPVQLHISIDTDQYYNLLENFHLTSSDNFNRESVVNVMQRCSDLSHTPL